MAFQPQMDFRSAGGVIVQFPAMMTGRGGENLSVVPTRVKIKVSDDTFTALVGVAMTGSPPSYTPDSGVLGCGPLVVPANTQILVNPGIERIGIWLEQLLPGTNASAAPPDTIKFRLYAVNAGGKRTISFDRVFTLSMKGTMGANGDQQGDVWAFADWLIDSIGPVGTAQWELWGTIPTSATNAADLECSFRLDVRHTDELPNQSVYGPGTTQDAPA